MSGCLLEQCDLEIDASHGFFTRDSGIYYDYRNEDIYFDGTTEVKYPNCRYNIRQDKWECDCGE